MLGHLRTERIKLAWSTWCRQHCSRLEWQNCLSSVQQRVMQGLLRRAYRNWLAFLKQHDQQEQTLQGLCDLIARSQRKAGLSAWKTYLAARLKAKVEQVNQILARKGAVCQRLVERCTQPELLAQLLLHAWRCATARAAQRRLAIRALARFA